MRFVALALLTAIFGLAAGSASLAQTSTKPSLPSKTGPEGEERCTARAEIEHEDDVVERAARHWR